MGKRRDHNRIGRTALTLLLSVVMTITFMPAWAFAVTETPAPQGETTAAAEEAQAGNEDISADAGELSETLPEDVSAEDADSGSGDLSAPAASAGSDEDSGASDEEGEDIIVPEPEAGKGRAAVSGETDKGSALLLQAPEAKAADKAAGAPDGNGDEADETGGNGNGDSHTTVFTMVRLTRFYIYTVVDGLPLTAGRLDDLFVSDVIFHIF